MSELTTLFLENWEFILLVFIRVSGLIFSSPIFGRTSIPTQVKIGFCASLTLLFVSAVPEIEQQMAEFQFDGNVLMLVLLCVLELLYGLVLGYVQNLFFQMVAFTGGQIIDMQMSFGMVNVFDVQSNLSVPMMGNFFNLLLLMVFFSTQSYGYLIQIMLVTIKEIPIGTTQLNPQIGLVALKLFIEAFVLACIIAMPVIASGLVGEACFGILMRVVPQMNAFAIGIPVKVILGFLVVFAMIPIYVQYVPGLFDKMFQGLEEMFDVMRAAPS